jgi:hypothetical protein
LRARTCEMNLEPLNLFERFKKKFTWVAKDRDPMPHGFATVA